jgi:hypothetical protein
MSSARVQILLSSRRFAAEGYHVFVASGQDREGCSRNRAAGGSAIDGGIDGERLRTRRPELAKERGEDGLLGINAIAETYW